MRRAACRSRTSWTQDRNQRATMQQPAETLGGLHCVLAQPLGRCAAPKPVARSAQSQVNGDMHAAFCSPVETGRDPLDRSDARQIAHAHRPAPGGFARGVYRRHRAVRKALGFN